MNSRGGGRRSGPPGAAVNSRRSNGRSGSRARRAVVSAGGRLAPRVRRGGAWLRRRVPRMFWLRSALAAPGLFLLAVGARRLAQLPDPYPVLEWLAGAVLLHDAAIAPVVLLTGLLVTRLPARKALRTALLTGGSLLLITLPALLRPHPTANPSVLPLPYGRNLLVLLAATALAALAATATATLRARRRARRHRPCPAEDDDHPRRAGASPLSGTGCSGRCGAVPAGVKINEASRITGVSTRSLRHYEEEGLIVPGRCANGYRDYCSPVIERVVVIRSLLESGLPIRLIKEVLPYLTDSETGEMCAEFVHEVSVYRDRLAARIADLSAQQDALDAFLTRACPDRTA